jgi:hypothetical protein
MRFRLTQDLWWCNDVEKRKLEKLGFKFTKEKNVVGIWYAKDTEVYIEINTLEELLKFTDKYGEIVFSKGHIEIYNGYREY